MGETVKAHRVNVRISEQDKARLDRIIESGVVVSVTDAIRKSLALLDELVRLNREGGQVNVEESSGDRYRLRLWP